MGTASPAERPLPLPEELEIASREVTSPSKACESGGKKVDGRMPVAPTTTMKHLHQLLLLLLLATTQLLSWLGCALRCLGHALEELAASARRASAATSNGPLLRIPDHRKDEQRLRETTSPLLLLRDTLPLRLGGTNASSSPAPSSSPSLCYADAAGAALPPDSLLDEVCSELKRTLYTNPHSGGEGAVGAPGGANGSKTSPSSLPPSDSSRAAADECRAATLALLNAPPDEYSVVFTSGATAALALVADAFPWERGGNENGESRCRCSRFLFTRDNHTSVLGLRSAALAAGASATPVAISRAGEGKGEGKWVLSPAAKTMKRRGSGGGKSASLSRSSPPPPPPPPPGKKKKVPCLLAFPLESNFSGARYSELAGESLRRPGRSAEVDAEEAKKAEWSDDDEGEGAAATAGVSSSFGSSPRRSLSPSSDENDGDWSVVEDRQKTTKETKKKREGEGEEEAEGEGEESWFVLADAAKAATAGSASLPDLSSRPVDFLCLSFYKLFGYPTGLGALVVSRRGLEALRRGRQGRERGSSRFFGGGTVLSASASTDSVSIRPGVAGLEDGTPAFLAIAALRVAFRHLAREHGGSGGGGGEKKGGDNALRRSVEAAAARARAVASALASALLSLRHADGSRVAVVYGSYKAAADEHSEGGLPTWARGGAPAEGGAARRSAPLVGQGAVVAFNLLRPRSPSASSSSFSQRAVGHREVERLAGLHGVLLRGGTLCNPGAAELALGRRESERESGDGDGDDDDGGGGAFSSSSSETKEELDCREGSGLDSRGDPTGVLRASFGAGASEEDARAVLDLVRLYFVDGKGGEERRRRKKEVSPSSLPFSPAPAAPPVAVTELFVYPVKGASGFSPPSSSSSWPLRANGGGLAFDREFAVVDASENSSTSSSSSSPPSSLSSLPPSSLRRRLVTPRRCPRLARLRTFIDLKQRELVLTMASSEAAAAEEGGGEASCSSPPLRVPLDEFSSDDNEKDSSSRALSSLVSAWLTSALGMPCSLVRAPKNSTRGWANEGDLLLVGRESLAALRERLSKDEGEEDAAAAASAPERFRPNIVVDRPGESGMEPHEEDSWASLKGGGGGGEKSEEGDEELLLVAAGGCARCPAVNIDRSDSSPSSGAKQQQQQPLLELAGYRRSVETGRIEFGVLLQRKARATKEATAPSPSPATTESTSAASSSSWTSWLSVGDLLFPTLREPNADAPAAGGGASCA